MWLPLIVVAASGVYLANRHWHWFARVEHHEQMATPPPAPAPETTGGFDPGLPVDTNRAVTTALQSETSPAKLRSFALTMLPDFPGAASHLNARAAALEGPPPAPTPEPTPGAPVRSVPVHAAALRRPINRAIPRPAPTAGKKKHHGFNLFHALGTAVHDATNIGAIAVVIPGIGQTFVPLALAASAAAAGHTKAVKNAPGIRDVRKAASSLASSPAWKFTVGSWQQAYDQANPAHFAATLAASTADKTLHGENFEKALKEAGDTAATYMINKAQYASMVVGVPPAAVLGLKAATVAAKAAQTGHFDARSMVDLAISAIPDMPPQVATALDTAAEIAAKKGHLSPDEIINLAAQNIPGGAAAIPTGVLPALKMGANIAAHGGKLDPSEVAGVIGQAVPGMTPSELGAIQAGVKAIAPGQHGSSKAVINAVQSAASKKIPGDIDPILVQTLTSAAAVAQGAPVASNAVQLAAQTIPGGPGAQQAVLSGAHLGQALAAGKNAIGVMASTKRHLSAALQPAFDVGAGLALGRALQNRGFTEGEKLVPGETIPVKVLNALSYSHAFVDSVADIQKRLPPNAAALARQVAVLIDTNPALLEESSYDLAKKLKTPEPVVRAVLGSTHDIVPGAPVIDTRQLYAIVGLPPAPTRPSARESAVRAAGSR